MARSLTSRIVLVIVACMVAAWLAMALGLVVLLSGMHADGTKSSLADIGQTFVVRFRDAVLDGQVQSVAGEIRDAVAGSGIGVQVERANGAYVALGDTTGSPAEPIDIPAGAVRGQTITGDVRFDDGSSHLYAAIVLRQTGVVGPRAVILSVPDRSRAQAIGDLTRTLPLLILASVAVGLPLAWWLSRSVAGPLRRLSAAAAELPTGHRVTPLPLEGPKEVRDLTATFNAMTAELAAASDRESALLADLRHDLRTPLTVISGYATALADGTLSGAEAVPAAEAIGAEAARLERLIADLGATERISQGSDRLRPESLDAIDVLEATRRRFAPGAEAAGVIIEIAGPSVTSLPFVADRAAVDRVLGNLVSNALAVVPAPGGHVRLSADAGTSNVGPAVTLAVTDDGPGFPPGSIPHVFERFYRADPARTGPGSGLGLAIARELVIGHGGSISAENVSPHGARVSATFPAVPSAT